MVMTGKTISMYGKDMLGLKLVSIISFLAVNNI